MKLLATLLLATTAATAQFQILDGKTTASLRGIDAVSPQIAWASGSGGTILLTTDGGATWKHCVVPAEAVKADFRGIQGFDAKTAVAMSIGKGTASALYKTTDGCATWKLVFADPYADGFFDALIKVDAKKMYLMGDPVDGKFEMYVSGDQGATWALTGDPGLESIKDAGGFAASNTSLLSLGQTLLFGTSATATDAPRIYRTNTRCVQQTCRVEWLQSSVPIAQGSTAMGVFSLAGRTVRDQHGLLHVFAVAVGGDYTKPSESSKTSAYSANGEPWQPSLTTPHGYRSAVTYDPGTQVWIAVGPNGCDLSRDDGRNWSPLRPSAADAPDADTNWNAISLPFAVGSRGKMGKLEPAALTK